MCSCGDIGKERADQVLLRVPISLSAARPPRQGGNEHPEEMVVDEEDGEISARSARIESVLKEVIKTCYEYGRDEVRRTVCSVSLLLSFAPWFRNGGHIYSYEAVFLL